MEPFDTVFATTTVKKLSSDTAHGGMLICAILALINHLGRKLKIPTHI